MKSSPFRFAMNETMKSSPLWRLLPLMMVIAAASASSSTPPTLTTTTPEEDLALVQEYLLGHANETFRPATGLLPYPYLVPSGPYEQCWDWDSVFTGVGLLDLGGAPYLAGSMKNFFHMTNLTTGEVTQCVDPTTRSPSCSSSNESEAVGAHAKPLLIQGALFAARRQNDFAQFLPFQPQMEALLGYWERERVDPVTGALFTWHDQMESGADNMPTSPCPTVRSACWDEASDANTLASADVATQMVREHRAFAEFLDRWAEGGGGGGGQEARQNPQVLQGEAAAHRARAEEIAAAINAHLWLPGEDEGEDDEFIGDGQFVALNTSTRAVIRNAVYLAGVPLWAGRGALTRSRAAAAARRVVQPDLLSDWGLRSTSSADPWYTNEDIIYPYSNWRGPVWVVANAMVAYGLLDHGFTESALEVAQRVTSAFAGDLRATGTLHEAITSGANATTGEGAGVGTGGAQFISWNTLLYRLLPDVEAAVNPTAV